MASITSGNATFVWWNTSLSPPIPRPRADDNDRAFVVQQVKALRDAFSFGILGLGEVQGADLDAIMDGLDDTSMELVDATDRTGRLMFDTAIIFDRTRFALVERRTLLDVFGKSKFKLGELATFLIVDSGATIHVVASHWPSRQTSAEFEPRRAQFGMLLRQSLERLRQEAANPYIVLMGDYNDDPFSPSLASNLLATRDRQLAKRNPDFFYNPFWRRLGESLPHVGEGEEPGVCGTHFYPGGHYTEWFTYDQIIFSSAFLSQGPLLLDEEHTGIVSTPELYRRVRRRRYSCDHLPVLGVVSMRTIDD